MLAIAPSLCKEKSASEFKYGIMRKRESGSTKSKVLAMVYKLENDGSAIRVTCEGPRQLLRLPTPQPRLKNI